MSTSDLVPYKTVARFVPEFVHQDDRLKPCECTSLPSPCFAVPVSPASEMTFCVIATPYPAHEANHFPARNPSKIKKAEYFSSAFFRLVPSPGTLPNPNLLKRGFGSGAGGDRGGAGLAHDCILNRAEGVHARLIRAHRVRPRCIATDRACHRERIAALGATRQCRINHA